MHLPQYREDSSQVFTFTDAESYTSNASKSFPCGAAQPDRRIQRPAPSRWTKMVLPRRHAPPAGCWNRARVAPRVPEQRVDAGALRGDRVEAPLLHYREAPGWGVVVIVGSDLGRVVEDVVSGRAGELVSRSLMQNATAKSPLAGDGGGH
jgi:hypothetical protein